MTSEEYFAWVEHLLDVHASQLMEFCDSVRIVATVNDPSGNGASLISSGGGNYYAQKGSIERWLEYERDEARGYAQQMGVERALDDMHGPQALGGESDPPTEEV
jgi:hypothetical protein